MTRAVPAILPPEAEFIISAIEAANCGKKCPDDRRQSRRVGYRAVVRLKLFSDPEGTEPWVLYTRDADMRALGFITRHRLPLGYGGTAVLCGPQGEEIVADCILQRCRETVGGWFEGCLAFNRDQWCFGEK